MKTAIFAIAVVLTSSVSAETTYDWESGNTYTTTPTYGGGARVNGYNLNTGSMWNSTIKSNGDMNGVDSDGNYWNYNKGSGSYFNTNGTTCFGKGSLRTCN